MEPSEGIQEIDLDQEPDWDDESSSTLVHEEVQERKQVWNGENRKAARDVRKAAKNQIRFNIITREELDKVQDALHPEIREAAERADQVPNGQGLADNETIDQNITFNSHTFKYGSLRQGVYEKKLARANDPRTPEPKTPEEERAILEPILASLGIRTNVLKPTKERKNLYARLQSAITRDVEAFENEQAETMKRMAGYWRYVNRRTYNQMVRNNELWDWATGQKLPEVEEESDLESIMEEDESESDTLDGSTPATTPMVGSSPETCYDSDFDLPLDGTPISMSQFIEGSDWDEDGRDPKTPTRTTFECFAISSEEESGNMIDRPNNSDLPNFTADTRRYPDSGGRPSIFGPFVNDNSDIASSCGTGKLFSKGSLQTPRKQNPRVRQLPDTATPASPIPFGSFKDNRFGGKVAHNASPPKKVKVPREPKAFPDIGITIPPVTSNIYGHLDREIPAPCEEKKKEPTPLARPVLNIVVPPKPVAEFGWEVKGMKGRAKKTNFPPMPMIKGLASKKLAAANAQKPGAGLNYAAMAKKAMNH